MGVLLEGVVVCLVFRTEITELLVVLLSAILQLILIEILMLTMTLRKGRSIKVVLQIVMMFQTYLNILSMIKRTLPA